MKTVRTITLLLCGLLLMGCCPCRRGAAKERMPLAGTEWQLIQLNGETVRLEAGEFTLTLSEQEGTFTGSGSCNRLMGGYSTGNKQMLKIGPVASTRMACSEPEKEYAFIAALEAATRYDMDGKMLLLFAGEKLLAVFQPLEPASAARETR